MQLVSYANAVAKKTVTCDPTSAGLVSHTADELKNGLVEGFVCGGGPSSKILCAPPGKHVLVAGGTGAGKTLSTLGPTICANGTRRTKSHRPKSMIVVDCKHTLWRETAGYLETQGYVVRVVDLSDPESDGRWNPLGDAYAAVRERHSVPEAERSISNLKSAAIASVRSDRDKYWENAAWDAISSVALAKCLMGGGEPTLADVRDTIYDDVSLLMIKEVLGDDTPKGVLSCIDLFRSERTWSCVKSTVGAMLGFYVTDTGRHVSGTSNIHFKEDFFGRKPVCYYVISPDTSELCGGYTVQFIECATRAYMEEFEARGLEGSDRYALMLVIDEFARLPRCEQILALVATGRSRNCTAYLAVQSFSQFLERGLYTREEAAVILEQAAVNVYMSNTSREIAEDAKFKSGGVVGARQMLLMEPGDAYVRVAGKPMIATHMEPLSAYEECLGHAPRAMRADPTVDRDGMIERILDLCDDESRNGNEWEVSGEDLLDMLLTALSSHDGSVLSDKRPDRASHIEPQANSKASEEGATRSTLDGDGTPAMDEAAGDGSGLQDLQMELEKKYAELFGPSGDGDDQAA